MNTDKLEHFLTINKIMLKFTAGKNLYQIVYMKNILKMLILVS